MTRSNRANATRLLWYIKNYVYNMIFPKLLQTGEANVDQQTNRMSIIFDALIWLKYTKFTWSIDIHGGAQ